MQQHQALSKETNRVVLDHYLAGKELKLSKTKNFTPSVSDAKNEIPKIPKIANYLKESAGGQWNVNFIGIFWQTLNSFWRYSLACLTESCSLGYGSRGSRQLPGR